MRILLVRLRLIGDVVFTTPLIRALRRHDPTGHLAYLVEPAAAPVVRDNPHLDEVIVAPKRHGLARVRDDLALARRLRRQRFDVAIDLHGGPRSAWLTYGSGAPMRIGYRIKGRTWMYTHRVDRAADLTPRHSVTNQWDLLAPLGIEGPTPERDPVEMAEDPAAAVRLEQRLQRAGVGAGDPIVLVHVSAGNPFRRWPAESFVALVVQLARANPARRIVLFSGPSEPEAGQRIAAAARIELGALAASLPAIGEPDLQELRLLIARAAVYIGGDTGPMHIAATTMTPIVELLGPTLAERSRPWRDGRWFVETVDVGPLPCRPCHQRVCVPGDFRCLVGITPARVAAAAERALERSERLERPERSERPERPERPERSERGSPMPATTLTLSHDRTEAGLERLTFLLMLGFVAALQMSIAAAQILLAATVLAWIALLVRDKTRPALPRFFIPLTLYAVATLVSSYFSVDPRESLIDDKQLVLFAIVPAVYDIARGPRASTTIDVLVSVGAASAAFGIIQYGMLHYDNLGRRPEGALTHYMTYSGVLMLVIAAAVARLVFGSRDRIWPALVMPALVVALALTFTRGAWVGAAVAVTLLFVLRDFRLAVLLPVVFGVMFFIAPDRVATRVTSMFNAQDPANQDRLAMVEIGARILRDHPLTGVGPNMIPRVYERYRPDYAVNKSNPHLHNVPLQIAAERGVPALLAWLAFMAVLIVGLLRLFRRGGDRVLPATGLAAIAAMLAAGLFEYNFGDSEFLMLFLVLVTLPFAAARQGDPAQPRADRAAAADRT